MSYRKDQEAARKRAAEPISVDEFARRHWFKAPDGAGFTAKRTSSDHYEMFYWNGPGTGWTKVPPYNWKEDPDCTDKFRVLPDGTLDLHPSQWSVIA
jgi:hypothetical protein